MKKLNACIFFLTLLSIMASCTRESENILIDDLPMAKVEEKRNIEKKDFKIDYDVITKEYKDPYSPFKVTLKATLPIIEGEYNLVIIINNLIIDYYERQLSSELSYQTAVPKDRLSNLLSSQVEKILTETKGLSPAPKQEWFGNFDAKITNSIGQYLFITMTYDQYFGGAHGMYGTKYLIVDLSTFRSVEKEAIFTNISEVKDISAKYLFKHLKNNHLLVDDLLVDANDYFLTNNFTIRNDSLILNYNVYEIAPYYWGEIEYGIPLSELKPYMKVDIRD